MVNLLKISIFPLRSASFLSVAPPRDPPLPFGLRRGRSRRSCAAAKEDDECRSCRVGVKNPIGSGTSFRIATWRPLFILSKTQMTVKVMKCVCREIRRQCSLNKLLSNRCQLKQTCDRLLNLPPMLIKSRCHRSRGESNFQNINVNQRGRRYPI